MEHLEEIHTAAQMRETSLVCQSVGEERSSEGYLKFLGDRGVKLNPKLYVSKFQLKNGLPYIGVAVREEVRGQQVLIRVPEDLILSSAKALEQPLLKELYQSEAFFIDYDEYDQDKILGVYCMLILKKKEESSPWYQMINNFPKQCDIACFWKEQELDQFKDLTIKSAAQINLKNFEKEWTDFLQIQPKYKILQTKEFNKENYRTIFIALKNRAFGYKVKYTSLVPMAELFNHHCSKVHYLTEKEKRNDFVGEDDEGSESSLGSCQSETYNEEGQFDYQSVELNTIDFETEEEQDLPLKEKTKVVKECDILIFKIDEELNWADFTVLFVGHLILKIRMIKKDYLSNGKSFDKVMMQLGIVQKCFEGYKQRVSKYYETVNKKVYFKQKDNKQVYENPPLPKYKKDYESLIIKTSKTDKTNTNQQIYFKYGSFSNRFLILNYGFAIQGNKYQHFWISFDVSQGVADFPDVLEKIIVKKLSLRRKFKIYHHRLCMDLIVFFRLNSWAFWGEKAIDHIFAVIDYQREICILEQVASTLRDNVEQYEDDYDLTDKSLNYHQYFTTVYHLQKLRIVQKQVKMVEQLLVVLGKLNDGLKIRQAIDNLTKSERTILRPYLDSIVSRTE